jgi:hypothetical protein
VNLRQWPVRFGLNPSRRRFRFQVSLPLGISVRALRRGDLGQERVSEVAKLGTELSGRQLPRGAHPRLMSSRSGPLQRSCRMRVDRVARPCTAKRNLLRLETVRDTPSSIE